MSAHTLTAGTATARRPRSPMTSFYAGAAIDLVLGLELMLFGGWFAALMLPDTPQILGLSTALLLRLAGGVLLLFAVDTFIVARSQGRLARFRPAVMAANWVGAALCLGLALLAAPVLSTVGVTLLVGLALIGAVVAMTQKRALRVAALASR